VRRRGRRDAEGGAPGTEGGSAAAGACPGCLRRSQLIGFLAPRIAGLLGRPGRPPAGALALGEEELVAALAGRRAPEARAFLERFDERAARGALEARGIGAACRHGSRYPAALLELPDPPAVLYWYREPARIAAALAGPAVTVVGTRRASPYALEVAHDLGRGLAAAGVAVVSGLALGVDSAAHRGAVAAGGPALAVLARGVDRAYPRLNGPLYDRVVEAGGILSELPPGCGAFRWSFPARNRLMAALGGMTIVVEAAERSGSLITAAFAGDLGREVGAVPGRVTARVAAGSNRLLREGACVVRSAEDALDDLFGVGRPPMPGAALPGGGAEARVSARAADGAEPELSADADADTAAPLDPVLGRVLDAVEAGADVPEIGRSAGLSAAGVRAALGRLELLGLVTRGEVGGWERTTAVR
jgi:DNA processing protein